MPSPYVVISVPDTEKGGVRRLVLENALWAQCWLNLHGLTWTQTREEPQLSEVKYVEYMRRHEGEVLDITAAQVARCFAQKDINDHTVNTPMTLASLGVTSKDELLQQYFDLQPSAVSGFASLKTAYIDAYGHNIAFIALLNDLGYLVREVTTYREGKSTHAVENRVNVLYVQVPERE